MKETASHYSVRMWRTGGGTPVTAHIPLHEFVLPRAWPVLRGLHGGMWPSPSLKTTADTEGVMPWARSSAKRRKDLIFLRLNIFLVYSFQPSSEIKVVPV